MSRIFQSSAFQFTLALLTGLGLGLAYSWLLSPVTYVDATPALLRSDFKDQYRIAIAAAYAANQDLPRAQARLNLLGDADPVAELSAQAQRMLAAGESFEKARPLAQLATDLQHGFASEPFTATPSPTFNTPNAFSASTLETAEPAVMAELTSTPPPTVFFEQTPLMTPLAQETLTPRATFTSTPGPGRVFILISQEPLCVPGKASLMQFLLLDSKNNQIPGIEIVVTWSRGEDRFFTGFKSELGDGYADFDMDADTVYNVRVAGGAVVTDIRAPACADPAGAGYPGEILLTFQRP